MSDIDELKALLTRWQVPFIEERLVPGGITVTFGNDQYEHRELLAPTVTGYAGFMTVVEFDTEGRFVKVGAWE